MAEDADRPTALVELESALCSLGVEGNAFSERWDEGAWAADWSGSLLGHEVYLFVMGAANHPGSARLMLDEFTFDDVRTEHLSELVRKVFAGDAKVTKNRYLLASKYLVLKVRIGSETYSASVSGDSVDDLSPWARYLAETMD
ncbi:hypothetical protein AB0D65_16205 [Streptomyces griseoloalbus]|uniref:YbjN domain-containing protein n=1 Tax=Streptomyces griseoloalbus TaxID=67303 RepID=A0ABV3E5R2_9ACTN